MSINYTALISAMQNAGLVVERLEAGRLVRCKTTSDKSHQKSGWYFLYNDNYQVTAVYGDWRTGSREVWKSESKQTKSLKSGPDLSKVLAKLKQKRHQDQLNQHAINRKKLIALWNKATPLSNTDPASRYLINRGVSAPSTDVLRYHAGLDYWHDGQYFGEFPAMLAAVTTPSGELVTLHRTFITDTGNKAPVPTVKKLCPTCGSLTGASVKLGRPKSRPNGSLGIGIAEGIETAIAAEALFDVTVWAGVSAHGMASFIPPSKVRNVYVFADNDINQTGQNAAKQLAERLVREGFTTRILISPERDSDWADILTTRRDAA